MSSISQLLRFCLLLALFPAVLAGRAVHSRPHNHGVGCGSNITGFSIESTGHYNRTLPSGRQYLLHVPAEYPSGKALPLVLSFHGADGLSVLQEKLSQFSTPGLRIAGLPIIAAYPQGVTNTTAKRSAVWAGAPYANTTVDDIQFTKDIITDLTTRYCIDPLRIYATGKSNGGGFTNLLACTPSTSRLFAAVGLMSPALYAGSLAFDGCDPGRAMPIITSHGVEDQTIPFLGRNDTTGAYGVGTATINVPLWRAQWAQRNGCRREARVSMPYVNTTEYTWTGRGEVKAFTVVGLGHSWPTTEGLDASGAPNNTAGFNITSPEIVEFFTRHVLPVGVL